MLQFLGDMPATPKPTITHIKFPVGSVVNHCNSGIVLETQTNAHLFDGFGNHISTNKKEHNNGLG